MMKNEEYFKSRRTVRKFSDRPVSDELIKEIVELAMRAPTTGNMQLYTVIASRKGESRKPLEALHFNQPASTGADVLLTVCADFNRFTRWCQISDADPAYDNILSFNSAMLDATILAQQIVTIAEMNGLGTCYLGTVNYNAPEISKLLKLPRLVVPVCCIALGYPEAEGDESERLPVESILSFEEYPQFSDEEIVDFFKAKDEYPLNAKFVEENAKKNLAQVFTDIRYPRSVNLSASQSLINCIREQGFMDEKM